MILYLGMNISSSTVYRMSAPTNGIAPGERFAVYRERETVIGDTAYKMTAVGGQGANQAIESHAVLSQQDHGSSKSIRVWRQVARRGRL